MVISKLMGGLGNQMFQYALGKNLAIKNHDDLKLDLNSYKYQFGVTPRSFELDVFNFKFDIAKQSDIANLVGYDLVNRIFNRFGIDLKSKYKSYARENGCGYNAGVLNRVGDTYLEGFWNSEKYFVNNEKQIRKDFIFKNKLIGNNKLIANEISNSNSISLHVRRGDYIKDKSTNKFHGTCGLDYYERAIELVNIKVKKPKYFVFSDDLEWVKANLKIKNAVYVDGNAVDKSYIDMQLMSLCKHNIIANSTFSWWGAWLNNNPNKIVIAPKKWFNDPKIYTSDLIPEKWIKI